MFRFCALILGISLLSGQALAEGWRVQSVSGDVVAVKGEGDPEPLDVGDTVDEGSTIVSDTQSSLKLTRRSDVVSLSSDSIAVVRPGGGTTRATIEAKSGEVEVVAGRAAGADGPLEVKTSFFRVVAATADFTIKARKDFATINVDSGSVQVDDSQHPGAPFVVGAGDSFRGEPAGAAAKAEQEKLKQSQEEQDKAKQAAEKKLAELDALAAKKKAKLDKSQSELIKKLAKRGAHGVKEGLDDLSDDYDKDSGEPEVPKIGILHFLFGPDAPRTSIVLGGILVLFLGLGYLSSAVLRSVGFGMFGNAPILLVGALVGAGIHDLLFSPTYFWVYEPTPGIFATVIGGLGALIGACFLRKHIEDRMDQALTAEAQRIGAQSAAQTERLRRFGG